MDRPLHERPLQADPFAGHNADLAFAETDQWGFGFEQPPDGAAVPKSTQDIREVYLNSRSGVTASAGVSMPDVSRLLTMASRVWASVRSPFPLDRRVVAGLGLVGLTVAMLVGVARYDFAPSIKTASGTTYNSAVGGLTTAVGAARDLVGKHPEAPVTTKDVASGSRKGVASVSRKDVASVSGQKVPDVKPTTGKPEPIDFSRGRYLMPPLSIETVQDPSVTRALSVANRPAPIRTADVNATVETRRAEALAVLEEDPAVETAIVYSPDDTDVSPPVVIRSPGIGTNFKNVSLIEILVSETGRVESARGQQRPATLAAALESATALSVVKTWRFRPARRNGQAVKYRTTVSLVDTLYPAGTILGSR